MENSKTSEDKKTRILYAAVKIFAKKGLERGKIADIATQAGIGKGTIYEYFKSKGEIFDAIENMFITDSVTQIKKMANSNNSPTKQIEVIFNYSVNMHDVMGDTILLISEMWAQHSRGQWHDHKNSNFAKMYNSYRKVINGILNRGVDNGEFRKMNKDGVSTMLLALIDGMIWQNVIFKDDKNFVQWKKEAIKSFMNGILL